MDKHECFAVIYLRPDGTPANRVDYYATRAIAEKRFNSITSIHGPYPNGAPRWRLVHLVEVLPG